MKKILLFILLLLPTVLSLKAQISNQLRYGFINQKGELAIPAKYKKVGDFKEGYAIVQKENNELFIINKNGVETPIKNKNYVEGFGKLSNCLTLFPDLSRNLKLPLPSAITIMLFIILGNG
jgi:hypothetical protein